MIPVMVAYNRRPARKRLLAADYEGTLLAGETMEALGAHITHAYAELDGRTVRMDEYMREITQRGMRGEMPFARSLAMRVAAIGAHMTMEEMKTVVGNMPLRSGAREMLETVSDEYDIAVITGGLYPLVRHSIAANGLRIDYLAASSFGREVCPSGG